MSKPPSNSDIFLAILLLLFVLLLVAIIIYSFLNILETFYIAIFGKPAFIYTNIINKKLSKEQKKILENEFLFYKKLTDKRKIKFEHRVAMFIKRYNFYGKEDLEITDQMKVLIASTAIMLTFGFREYLFTVIDKIIIYPDVYYSSATEQYHKGEFNPKMKALVFSWAHFLEGYQSKEDNLNLGIHELAHVLHFQGLKSTHTSAAIFADTYTKLMKEVMYQPNLQKLIASDYFRIYAYTNQFEFIAVLLEHFFETPEDFKKEFPQLFYKIKKMINFREL